jgi:hypothetical protein
MKDGRKEGDEGRCDKKKAGRKVMKEGRKLMKEGDEGR